MSLTLRWSIWNQDSWRVKMLTHSISSFQKYFPEARYIVTAEHPSELYLDNVEVLPQKGNFLVRALDPHIIGLSLYRKFNPLRLTTDGVEIYMDLDIFCIREPTGIKQFINSDHMAALQTRTEIKDNEKDRPGFGLWDNLIDKKVPPCSSGVIGFKGNFNFEHALCDAYKRGLRFKNNFFNEQGSVIYCLQDKILSGEVFPLTEKYIRDFHPWYPVDISNTDTEMVHCIDSQQTNYHCFRQLLRSEVL